MILKDFSYIVLLVTLTFVCLSSHSLQEDDDDTTSTANYRNILNKTDEVTKPPIDRTKEVILCEVEKSDETIFSSCDLKSLNFTFYAVFRPKRSLNVKTLLELKKSLVNSSTCEIRYMKVYI